MKMMRQLNQQDGNDYMFKVSDVDEDKVMDILGAARVTNSHFNEQHFLKYLTCSEQYVWKCLYFNDRIKSRPVAMCVLQYSYPVLGYCYVAEIQSFESGHSFGKKLLEYVFKFNDNVWLIADFTAGKKLLDFYRSFSFDECCAWSEYWKAEAHAFSKGCDKEILKQTIVARYVQHRR